MLCMFCTCSENNASPEMSFIFNNSRFSTFGLFLSLLHNVHQLAFDVWTRDIRADYLSTVP